MARVRCSANLSDGSGWRNREWCWCCSGYNWYEALGGGTGFCGRRRSALAAPGSSMRTPAGLSIQVCGTSPGIRSHTPPRRRGVKKRFKSWVCLCIDVCPEEQTGITRFFPLCTYMRPFLPYQCVYGKGWEHDCHGWRSV